MQCPRIPQTNKKTGSSCHIYDRKSIEVNVSVGRQDWLLSRQAEFKKGNFTGGLSPASINQIILIHESRGRVFLLNDSRLDPRWGGSTTAEGGRKYAVELMVSCSMKIGASSDLLYSLSVSRLQPQFDSKLCTYSRVKILSSKKKLSTRFICNKWAQQLNQFWS